MTLQLVLVSVLSAAFLIVTAKGVALTHAVRRERTVTAEWEAAKERKPEAVSEPKIPRDKSRTYPRPKGSRSKLNRVCPVCGTGRETGDLDRRVLGWPAHRTCAEWLGDWKPAFAPGAEFRPSRPARA